MRTVKLRALLVSTSVFAIIFLIIFIVIAGKDALRVRNSLGSITTAISNPLDLLNDESRFNLFQSDLNDFESSIEALQQDLSYVKALTWPLKHLPLIGTYVNRGETLIELARLSSKSARLTFESYRPGIPLQIDSEDQIKALELQLQANRPILLEARKVLNEARSLKASVIKKPSGPLMPYFQKFDQWSGVLIDIVDASLVAPSLLFELNDMKHMMTALANPPIDLKRPLSLVEDRDKLDNYAVSLKEVLREVENLMVLSKKVKSFRNDSGTEPNVGPLLPLLDSTYYGLKGATHAIDSVIKLASLMDSTSLLSPEFGQQAEQLISEVQHEAIEAQKWLNVAVLIAERLESDPTSGTIQGSIKQATDALKKAQEQGETFIRILHLIRFILGIDSPRTYLVLGQDEDELRPTGGFIGVVQELVIDRGVLKTTKFKSSYNVDTSETSPWTMTTPLFKIMPEPLAKGLFGEREHLWYFRDSNWWSDYPSSAIEVSQSYRRATGVSLDGVFAITQSLTGDLIDAVGGIQVDGLAQRLYGEDALKYINAVDCLQTDEQRRCPEEQYTVREDHDTHHRQRAIVQDISSGLLSKLKTGLNKEERMNVLKVIARGLGEKTLMAYVNEPQARIVLRKFNWDGAIPRDTKDYLFISESNLVSWKQSQSIVRRFLYQVNIDGKGRGESYLRILYYNPNKTDKKIYRQAASVLPGHSGVRGYYTYIKFFVPEGTDLLDSSPLPLPEGTLFEDKQSLKGLFDKDQSTLTLSKRSDINKTEVDFFTLIKEDELKQIDFKYTLPKVVENTKHATKMYELYIQKQAGTSLTEVEVEVVLPPSSHLITTSHTPQNITDNHIIFLFQLNQDQHLHVEFE